MIWVWCVFYPVCVLRRHIFHLFIHFLRFSPPLWAPRTNLRTTIVTVTVQTQIGHNSFQNPPHPLQQVARPSFSPNRKFRDLGCNHTKRPPFLLSDSEVPTATAALSLATRPLAYDAAGFAWLPSLFSTLTPSSSTPKPTHTPKSAKLKKAPKTSSHKQK